MLTVDIEGEELSGARNVLDVGCGGGRHAYALLKKGRHVIAVDTERQEIKQVRSMIDALRGSGEVEQSTKSDALVADTCELPFASSTFDAVIASEILEHIREDAAAIGELARVLRTGGVLALSVPRAGPELVNWALSRRYHDRPGGHVRIYRRGQLLARVEAGGFRLLRTQHRHGLHSPYWWLRCAVGVDDEDNRLVTLYHRFLVWDIVKRPMLTRLLERVLDPLIGKSLVCYFERVQ